MQRRKFVRNTLIAGWVLPNITLYSCSQVESPINTQQSSSPDYSSFELEEITVNELQEKMANGALTAAAITQMYLDRIEQIDKNGPQLNSVIEVNPDALSIAQELDEERKNGNIRGPLHGIPVIIKDNINTGDKMMTTAGSLVLDGNYAGEDAPIVVKLRAAGAILLAKANLSEWANFRSSRSSSGWSSRGGQCKNPYILDRNPCGSSSGSGASVSANLCMIAIGTETNGSIVCPSNNNGVVGIKPTVGLWSRTGIIPISFTQDTAGPMARTVTDAAILLGPLAGEDPKDSKTAEITGKYNQDYTQFLDADGLNGARLGIIKDLMGFHEKVDAGLEAVFEKMRAKGATIVELESPEEWRGLGSAGLTVLNYEFKDGLKKYLETVNPPSGVKTLADIIAYNQENADQIMPYFQQERMDGAEESGEMNDPKYLEALKKSVEQSRKGIDRLLTENNLDALLGPTGGPAWTIDVINGDRFGGGSSSPAARAGYPNITVPAGMVEGLPFGLSFFGTAFSEPELIKLAYAFEQATKMRKAPEFKATL
ncbi:MAG: amidase [Bacteroidota bacterium]